jgi:hypothetical protein
MSVSLACTPTSPAAVIDACRIDLSGAEDVIETDPAFPVQVYTLRAYKSGFGEVLTSVEFTPNADGEFTWDNLVFPESGAWHVQLRNAANANVGSALAVTVT